jgi:hypothetical protein
VRLGILEKWREVENPNNAMAGRWRKKTMNGTESFKFFVIYSRVS